MDVSNVGDDRLIVWRALVAYTGDIATAETAFVAASSSAGERWHLIFTHAESAESGLSAAPEASIELLSSQRGEISIGGELSQTLAALTAMPGHQRRALIAKHIGRLSDGHIAELLGVSVSEIGEWITNGEAALVSGEGPQPVNDVFVSPAERSARRFEAFRRLSLPATLDAPVAETTTRRFDLPTMVTAAAVALVAIVGLALIAGNPGVESAAVEQTTSSSAPPVSVTVTTQELAREVQGPDRSQEISVSPLGEIVRLDQQSGDEIWRTSPLGDIELTSVDLNTVTIRKGEVLLRVSLADGTFLPP